MRKAEEGFGAAEHGRDGTIYYSSVRDTSITIREEQHDAPDGIGVERYDSSARRDRKAPNA